ncbi:hypothetical protein BGX33_005222 [Mortierella sp. NVP41]|nr:hypothetical protein BGX33_005222 [Mortierella sp. NVP41]
MVKSEENSGAGSLPCTQTDSPISIESAVDTIAVPPESTTASLSEHQEQDQQPKVENSGTAPSATLQKRKWSRPTKVVKLEVEGKAPVQAEPEGGQSNDENDDDDDEQNISSESEDSDGEYGKSTKRTKVERPLPLFKSRAEAEMSEYEKQRLENIRRNQEMLMSLELPTAVTQLQIATLEGKPASEGSSSTDGLFKDTPVPVRISRQREWKAAPKIVQPVRVSNRIRGVAITPAMIGENDKPDRARSSHQDQQNATDDNDATTNADVAGGDGEEDMANLMSGDLFFDKATRERAIRVDGHYHGWLDPGVVERYGFETSAKDAWEANGGGSFSFKDPLGLQANAAGGTKSKTTKRPKHEAKMVAKGLFKKNPNAFFYRHNEPGQEQWTGDWTAEEQEIFLKVAKEHGCGDKWGLFASHIPHRVGYQCSNFYRQVVLPEGMVFDPNYEYTSRGKPIYCGKHNQWRK